MIHEQDIKYVSVTPPAAIIDNASATTAEIDTIGYDYCRVVVYLGATDIAMTALAVTQSDTSASGHVNVTGLIYGTSTDVEGNVSALPTATDDNGFFVFEIDLRGKKRYLDVTATIGDGALGTYIAIWAELSRSKEGRVSLSEKGAVGALRA